MPLPKGTRYAVKQTAKGPVRLAFSPSGTVIEALNLKTKDKHVVAARGKRKGT